jgi:hypothetical protein
MSKSPFIGNAKRVGNHVECEINMERAQAFAFQGKDSRGNPCMRLRFDLTIKKSEDSKGNHYHVIAKEEMQDGSN